MTTFVPDVKSKSLTLIPLLLLVATIFGFVSYKEFVFLKILTSDTDVPCKSVSVRTSSLVKPVTRSIITMFGGSR